MNQKLVLAIAMISVLVPMSSVSSKAQIAQTNKFIHIGADGTIYPPNANITTLDEVIFNLTGNIGASVQIERNNIIFDGGGYVVEGIVLSRVNNGTVKNTNINGNGSQWSTGIYVSSSSNCTIAVNSVSNSIEGITIWNSSHNTLLGNNVSQNGFSWGRGGLVLRDSPYNVFRSNRLFENNPDFSIDGGTLLDLIQDIDSSNTIADRPIYYYVNEQDREVPTDGSYVALVNCTSIIVKNLNLTKNAQGILLAYTANSTITQNYDIHGILMRNSTGNTVCDNTVFESGIYATYSDNNTISNNNISKSGEDGIHMEMSSKNKITDNNIAENIGDGIVLFWCPNNIVSNNNLTNNAYGLTLYQCVNNIIYHNNFIDNADQVRIALYSVNTWDDGYPSGGNYWSDYVGTDKDSGTYQNETGPDWIGDSPYVIDQNNADKYPLMNPYSSETGEIELAYRSLLMKSDQLQTSLNANINDLQGQVNILNSTANYLKTEVDNLTLTLNQTSSSFQGHIDSLGNTIAGLQAQINSLNSTLQASTSNTQKQYNSLNSQLDTMSKIMYLLAAMTAALMVTAVYIAARKPKQKTL